MISATLAILWLAAKRKKRSTTIPAHPGSDSPSINLSGYNTPRPHGDGSGAEQHNPPPRYNDVNGGYSAYPPGNAYNGGYNGGHSGYTTPPNGYRGDIGAEQQTQGRTFV